MRNESKLEAVKRKFKNCRNLCGYLVYYSLLVSFPLNVLFQNIFLEYPKITSVTAVRLSTSVTITEEVVFPLHSSS